MNTANRALPRQPATQAGRQLRDRPACARQRVRRLHAHPDRPVPADVVSGVREHRCVSVLTRPREGTATRCGPRSVRRAMARTTTTFPIRASRRCGSSGNRCTKSGSRSSPPAADPAGNRPGGGPGNGARGTHITTFSWCADFSDPFDFINLLLDGRGIQDENNVNVAYFDDPAYSRRMERASNLFGPARLRAYAKLEHDLVTKAAPWAAWSQPTNLFFFSDHVDMRSFAYQPIYEAPPYNLLALK